MESAVCPPAGDKTEPDTGAPSGTEQDTRPVTDGEIGPAGALILPFRLRNPADPEPAAADSGRLDEAWLDRIVACPCTAAVCRDCGLPWEGGWPA